MKFQVKEVEDRGVKEKAVFAGVQFPRGSVILDFHGSRFKKTHAPEWDKEGICMQIGNGIYLGASGMYDDSIRHSCYPNCGVRIDGDAIQLQAIEDIDVGKELTFDYSSTTDDPNWSQECSCGSGSCRRILRGYQYLPRRISARYRAAGVVPRYLIGK